MSPLAASGLAPSEVELGLEVCVVDVGICTAAKGILVSRESGKWKEG